MEAQRFRITGPRFVHLRDVLNVEVESRISLGLLNGKLGTGHICQIKSDSALIEASFDETIPIIPSTNLILAMPRPKVLRRILPELVALGLRKLIVVRSWRVDKSYLESDVLHSEIYKPLMYQGLMQGKYTTEPEFSFEPRFKPFMEDRANDVIGDGMGLLAHPTAEQSMVDVSVADAPSTTLAVGPEGGWIDYELESFRRQGFKVIRLGDRVLKVETACAVLMGQLELLRAQAIKAQS